MCIYYHLAVLLESWTRTTKEKNSWANTKIPACILQLFFLKQITIKHIKHAQ